jgi:hypothetical protein
MPSDRRSPAASCPPYLRSRRGSPRRAPRCAQTACRHLGDAEPQSPYRASAAPTSPPSRPPLQTAPLQPDSSSRQPPRPQVESEGRWKEVSSCGLASPTSPHHESLFAQIGNPQRFRSLGKCSSGCARNGAHPQARRPHRTPATARRLAGARVAAAVDAGDIAAAGAARSSVSRSAIPPRPAFPPARPSPRRTGAKRSPGGA